MSKYEIEKVLCDTCTEDFYALRDKETNEYFAGYDFMGSVDWSETVLAAYWMDYPEAWQIKSDLESADAPAEPVSPEKKEYLLRTVCEGIRQSSIKTGKQIADIYDYDQEIGVYSSIEVYDLDTLEKIGLDKLVTPILENKRWMEQEYRDYCENVREYGLDFEGR